MSGVSKWNTVGVFGLSWRVQEHSRARDTRVRVVDERNRVVVAYHRGHEGAVTRQFMGITRSIQIRRPLKEIR